MTIRPSISDDIPKIIQLLKKSLGESLMPKSEAYWKWKHIDNPFGKSPVWVAEEDGAIVGVRVFMRWSWRSKNSSYHAIRAVDTATDPRCQGKGIFKKLTVGLLQECEEKNIDLVFNTPNNQSKPGYLKMGWQEVGKLPVNLSIRKPINLLRNKFSTYNKTSFLKVNSSYDFSLSRAIEKVSDSNFLPTENLRTTYSKDYLKWRYQQIPNISYYANQNDDACIFFRIKSGALGRELRICDTFGSLEAISALIGEASKKISNYDYLSLEGFSNIKMPGLLSFKRSIGPDVTIRSLACKDLSNFNKFNRWTPTLGDLEVF